jgi:hypothetical protein
MNNQNMPKRRIESCRDVSAKEITLGSRWKGESVMDFEIINGKKYHWDTEFKPELPKKS